MDKEGKLESKLDNAGIPNIESRLSGRELNDQKITLEEYVSITLNIGFLGYLFMGGTYTGAIIGLLAGAAYPYKDSNRP